MEDNAKTMAEVWFNRKLDALRKAVDVLLEMEKFAPPVGEEADQLLDKLTVALDEAWEEEEEE